MAVLGLNGLMNRICVVVALMMLCGCRDHGGVHRFPIVPAGGDPPIRSESPSKSVTEPPDSVVEPVHTAPPPEVVAPAIDIVRVVDELNGRLQDVYFSFDSSSLAPDALAVVQGDAELLKTVLARFPRLSVTVEGHCDERGSAEYNLALGDRRARRVGSALHEFAAQLPAPAIISYGKEAPVCTDEGEACWQRNRRAHFVVKTGGQ